MIWLHPEKQVPRTSHQRVLVSVVAGETSWNQFYVGGLYEEEHRDGKIAKRHHIATPAGLIGVWTINTDGRESREYRVTDHLGSSSVVVNEIGDILQEHSFDPWGKPRNPDTWGVLSDWPRYLANRGYTGHEMLEEIELIHMNARIYDPVLGRFLSPDTFIQFEHDLQSYNRYAYVLNNPLRYTDPSGHFVQAVVALGAWIGKGGVVAAAIKVATIVNAAYNAYRAYEVGGVPAAMRSVAFSIVSFAAANAIGGYFQGFGARASSFGGVWGAELARAASHGLVSGSLSSAQGGKFGAGFASGFFGGLAGEWSTTRFGTPSVSGFMMSAVIGGTASEIGGGKFANGALSGAIVYTFNAAVPKNVRAREIDAQQPLNVVLMEGGIDAFAMDRTTVEKHFQILEGVDPNTGEQRRFRSDIVRSSAPGGTAITQTEIDLAYNSLRRLGADKLMDRKMYHVHTHPGGMNKVSYYDVKAAFERMNPSYMVYANPDLQRYELYRVVPSERIKWFTNYQILEGTARMTRGTLNGRR